MTLPFFNKADSRELTLRIAGAREAEDERHRRRVQEIRVDFQSRGLSGSPLLSTLWQERIDHQRQLTRIAREEIFRIVEAKRTRLNEADVEAITRHLAETFRHAIGLARTEFAAQEPGAGMPWNADPAFEMMIGSAIQQEAQANVLVKAADLRRAQRDERKKSWAKFGELVLAAAVGAAFTLLVQWLTG